MEIRKNKVAIVVLHLLVWLVLFGLPYFLSSGQEEMIRRIAVHTWIPMAFYAVIFYINYLWWIPSLLFRKKNGLFLVFNVVLIAAFVWLNGMLKDYFFSEFMSPPPGGQAPPRQFFLYLEGISFTVPLVFSVALKATERWIRTEAEQREAANIRLQSELRHLKYQLQPHFFFNALNNIYALVDVSPEMAKETIHSLGKLMRYLLYETNTGEVSLRKEIGFMEKYIELMKLRYSDNVRVYYDFPAVGQERHIAPLLFISLVENAFKHGVSAGSGADISFVMKLEGKQLTFTAANQNVPKTSGDKSGSGIGLQNLEKRLHLLYPERYTMETRVEDDRFIAVLSLEFQ
ncbi:sensor histidine kinase [Sinomicrobium oceani]|uniref:sensor histidine kinase n=1 Tax=Sinomicrobium oceani TaxID=1150368 RepID=UPI00227D1506|nr:histidine kinase [Sinomicrobium oceani]